LVIITFLSYKTFKKLKRYFNRSKRLNKSEYEDT